MKINPDDTTDDYAAFGRIVLLWGRIEAYLAGIVLSINHPWNKLPERNGVPSQFSGKRKRILEGFYALRKLDPVKAEMEAELKALDILHQKRSVIVHGHYQGTNLDGAYMFFIYESRDGEEKLWKAPQFTPSEIDELTADLARHCKSIEKLNSQIFALVHERKSQTEV